MRRHGKSSFTINDTELPQTWLCLPESRSVVFIISLHLLSCYHVSHLAHWSRWLQLAVTVKEVSQLTELATSE